MEITIKDIQNNLKSLPEELLGNVNDYIDFLKSKYVSKKNELMEVPDWHKEIVLERMKNPSKLVDAEEMIDKIENQIHEKSL